MPQQALKPDPTWLPYLRDAAWMPYMYDARSDALQFVHLPRETQQRAILLDPRFLARAPKSAPAPMGNLDPEIVRAEAGPIHFIFHTAFCCSTLLARALDVPGVSMGLKEPSVLATFAGFWSTGRRTPGALTALGLTLDMLSRPLTPGEAQIVKPSNVANHIIPQLLHLRPDAKAILLYSSLDAFLRAIVRRGLDGRAFGRSIFQQFAPAIPLDSGFSQDALFLQTDLQIAAQAWLMQAAFMDSIATRFGPSRVRLLNGDTLLSNKGPVLKQIADFYGLNLDAGACQTIAESAVFNEHAKQPTLAFDAASHQAQYDKAGETHFQELNSVRAWAHDLAGHCGIPVALTDTLAQ